MRISVAVQSWGGDCGPEPRSVTTRGGGSFQVTQSGDHLTFQLRRPRTTRQCWSENRAVRRVSSTYAAGTWRIICRTPPDDSRAETGTYTLSAVGEQRIEFRDISQYDWQLNESRCRATITTTQSFDRISTPTPDPTPEQPEAPDPEPDPDPEPTPSCRPGAPARLVLTPAQPAVAPGERLCFRGRVVDSNDCPTRSPVRFALASGAGRVTGRCYRAPNEEATAAVTATSGALSQTARVTVRWPDLSDLIARRGGTGSVGGGVPQDAEAESGQAARVVASEDGFDAGWAIWVLAAGVLLLGLGALLIFARRKTVAEEVQAFRDSLTPVPPAPSAAPSNAPGPTTPPPEDYICPVCRRGYPPGTTLCPHDGATPIPYSQFLAQTEVAAASEKVCPTCGTTYPANVTFCGKDGTPLEGG